MTAKIGFAGLGGMGFGHARLLADLGATIVAGADPSSAARDRFESAFGVPAYRDIEDLLAAEDLDAVNVTTPHTLHYDHVRAALTAGVHVHVEKPMVTDVADARELVALAGERDLVLQVGYQRHFDPRYREIKRFVDAGRVGTVHAATGYLEQAWLDQVEGTWRTDPSLSGGGQLYDSGSHLVDALLWLTDAEPRHVAAVMDRRGRDVDVNSSVSAILETDDGPVTASIGITGDGSSAPEVGEHLTLFGTDGSVTFDGDGITVTVDSEVAYSAPIDGGDNGANERRKLRHFVDAVEGDAAPGVPGEHGSRVVALTEAAYRAIESGRTVDVNEVVPRTIEA